VYVRFKLLSMSPSQTDGFILPWPTLTEYWQQETLTPVLSTSVLHHRYAYRDGFLYPVFDIINSSSQPSFCSLNLECK